MATLTKHLLSQLESASSRRLVVTGTSALNCDIFHVAPSSTTYDEMWVYAHNFSNSDVQVTFCWGLTSHPTTEGIGANEGVDITIPFKSGRALVFDGVLLSHSLSAAAYADTAGAISIDGFVNRIT